MDRLGKLNLLLVCIDQRIHWNDIRICRARRKNKISLYSNENIELNELRKEIHKEFVIEYDKKYESLE